MGEIAPYFCIHELAGAQQNGKRMVAYHIRGTASVPDGADLADVATRAMAALAAGDASPIVADIDRSKPCGSTPAFC